MFYSWQSAYQRHQQHIFNYLIHQFQFPFIQFERRKIRAINFVFEKYLWHSFQTWFVFITYQRSPTADSYYTCHISYSPRIYIHPLASSPPLSHLLIGVCLFLYPECVSTYYRMGKTFSYRLFYIFQHK